MDFERVLEQYGALRIAQDGRLRGAPELVSRRIKIESNKLMESRDIRSEVAALEARAEGWSRRASWVGRTPIAPDNTGPVADDIPIDGEWVCEGGEKSYRLVHGGGEHWKLIAIREVDTAEAGAITVLREDVNLIANSLAESADWLSYAVYWGEPLPYADSGGTVAANEADDSGDAAQSDGMLGIRRLATRFLGFNKAGQNG